MKKLLKKVSLVVAFAMAFALGFPATTNIVYAALINYRVEGTIIVEDFQSEAKLGDPYTIVQGVADDSYADVVETVYDPDGNIVTVTGDTFVVSQIGFYKITYQYVAADSSTYSTDLFVEVTDSNQGYTISLEPNSDVLVPSIIDPTELSSAEKIIQFPKATDMVVKDADGEIVASPTIVLDDSQSAGISGWNATDATFTIADTDDVTYQVEYKYQIDGKTIASTTISLLTDTTYENEYEYSCEYTNVSKPTTAEIGVKTILPGVKATNTTTSQEVKVNYSIKVKLDGTSTEYTTTDTTGVLTINEDGQYVFTPIVNGNYTVFYTVNDYFNNSCTLDSIKYSITDVKDKTKPVPMVTLPYTLNANGVYENPIDATEAMPSQAMAENFFILPIYATDAANGIVEDNLTLTRTIKRGSTVYFDESLITGAPADIAQKVLVFNVDESSSDPIRTKLAAYVADNTNDQTVFSVYLNGEEVEIKASQIYIVEKDSTGYQVANRLLTVSSTSYYAYYAAKDAAGKIATSSGIQMTIQTSAPVSTPEITLPTTLTGLKLVAGETFTFKVSAPTDQKDSRISNLVTYTTNASTTPVKANDTNSYLTYNEDSAEYTLTIPEDTTLQTITISAKAFNSQGVSAEETEDITIISTTSITSPTITTTPAINGEETLKVGENLHLPNVVYDNVSYPEYFQVRILAESPSGTLDTVNATNNNTIVETSTGIYKYTVKDAWFTPSESGIYKITYITKDVAGNQTIIFYTTSINPNTSNWGFNFNIASQINNGTAEFGEAIRLPEVNFSSNADTDYYTYQGYSIFYEQGSAARSGNMITPYETGDIKFHFIGTIEVKAGKSIDYKGTTYTAGQTFTFESKTYTISVKDTTAPTLANETEINEFYAKYNPAGQSLTPSSTEQLLIKPQVYTTTNDYDLAKSYITISYLGNEEDPFYLSTTEDIKYPFTENAVYTITYTLVDKSGNNKNEYSFTLNVGDVKAPKITVDTGVIDASSYEVGQTVSVDMSKIQATDNITNNNQNLITVVDGQYFINNECSINIYLQNTSTSTSTKITKIIDDPSDDSLIFQFDTTNAAAGEYKLVIEITDGQDQKATNDSTKLTITADDNTGASAEEVLGIVLIVISVLLLGGVVTYFIVSRKSFEKKYK